MSNKKELTMSEFRAIIKEEAVKLKRRLTLEAEKKALESELNLINEDFYGEEIEEGWVGDIIGTSAKAKAERLREEFITLARAWKKKGAIKGMSQEMLDDLMAQAEADGFEGKPGWDREKKTITYRPANKVNWKGLGLNRSGSFGGTGTGD